MSHPYSAIPDHQNWRRAPGAADPAALDPVASAKFTIAPDAPVACAGSCFAQHVMRHLGRAGFNTLVAEGPPALLGDDLAERFQYGIFSTRSGNIYTARQLLQLIQRANGTFAPAAAPWRTDAGLIDPFRPSIGPFASEAELEGDRAWHLACVREMISEMSVFVFTLGLTEAWLDSDGAVYPLVPGAAGGTFDPARHRFHNFTVEEVVADFAAALALIRAVNPGVRVILTVSPVPLMATALPRHVLQSTVYSKSVLRVAAQLLADGDEAIDYFPSYEIITAPHTRGRYFGPDARAVTEEGVDHVMRVFLKHYANVAPAPGSAQARQSANAAYRAQAQQLADAFCDEEALDGPR